MRVFVAVSLPETVRAALGPLLADLPFGRPADPEQLHLTLAFLGEQPDDMVEAAHQALEGVRFPRFGLQLAGLGTFPERRPQILWAGVAEAAQVTALHGRVLSALHGAGLMLERRRFRPHVTLARFDRLGAEEESRLARYLGRWSGFPAPAFEVEGFGLWRSTLHRKGAVHEELAQYPLR